MQKSMSLRYEPVSLKYEDGEVATPPVGGEGKRGRWGTPTMALRI